MKETWEEKKKENTERQRQRGYKGVHSVRVTGVWAIAGSQEWTRPGSVWRNVFSSEVPDYSLLRSWREHRSTIV